MSLIAIYFAYNYCRCLGHVRYWNPHPNEAGTLVMIAFAFFCSGLVDLMRLGFMIYYWAIGEGWSLP